MKRSLYCILFLLSLLAPVSGLGDVLLWSVLENATVKQKNQADVSLSDFLAPMQWDDWDYWYGAQIITSDGEILNQYFQAMDEYGNLLYYQSDGGLPPTTNPVGLPYMILENEYGTAQITDIGHPDSPNGVGAEWNMANAPREMLEEVEFQIQLVDANDNVLAWSDFVTGNWLMGKDGNPQYHTYETGSLDPPEYVPWAPTVFYTYTPSIPEPSTTLLMLIGVGLLGLRRYNIKKNKIIKEIKND